MTQNTHKCPRRFGPSDDVPDHWRLDNTCSYCGSVSGDVFMARLEASDIALGPTDKNYKVYVTNRGGPSIGQKFYFMHLTEAQKIRFIELMNERKLCFDSPGGFYRMPFFVAPVGP